MKRRRRTLAVFFALSLGALPLAQLPALAAADDPLAAHACATVNSDTGAAAECCAAMVNCVSCTQCVTTATALATDARLSVPSTSALVPRLQAAPSGLSSLPEVRPPRTLG